MTYFENDLLTKYSWVNVAFPISYTPLLSYHIEDQELPPIGSRIIAPIGSREVTGFVVDYPKEVQVDTRPISFVIDETPVITKEQIQLVLDSAKKYSTTVGEVLQTMLLAGLIQIPKKKIVCLPQQGKPLNPVEQKLFENLQKSKSLDYRHFCKNRSKEIPVLRAIMKKGWATLTTVTHDGPQKVKKVVFYRSKQISEKTKLGSVQKKILSHLQQRNDWVSEFELKKEFGAIHASIAKLKEKNILDSKEELQNTTKSYLSEKNKSIVLSTAQQSALGEIKKYIDEEVSKEVLLHGVTGSGKTEVYLQAAQYCLKKGKKVLALVPEISLTPQFLDRFIKRFGENVALLHSQRTDAQRLTEWFRIIQEKALIVVGTRSAVFAPLQDIGLIVMDEFHDGSYKQQDGIRYHAMDIIKWRSRYHQCPIVYGSATPNVEDYYRIETNVELPERVTGQSLPQVEICNMKNDDEFGKKRWIGNRLQEEIEATLIRGKQVLLFLNRRGYSHIVYCYRCGSEVHCPHCEVTMTYHKFKDMAQCHYCLYEQSFDTLCPTCHTGKLIHFGIGTQKVEEELRFIFPDANIVRLDRDQTTKKNLFSQTLKQLQNGQIDILIGTQMITKGLDFPNIELVGMVFADHSLYFPDYRSAETTFQLITQVVGRSGRGANQGKAIIQTLQPDHYAVVHGSQQNYDLFYQRELEYRKSLLFPPFSYLVLFEGVGRSAQELEKMMNWLEVQLQKKNFEIDILGPSPAPIAKIRDDYRYHLLLRGREYVNLTTVSSWLYQAAKQEFETRKMKLKMDISPIQFL
ncbi:MAG: primosomal protein N' [Bdellovibrionales bacterium]|nr:primosomal protein N' [Bdellovibrionales bacterium]